MKEEKKNPSTAQGTTNTHFLSGTNASLLEAQRLPLVIILSPSPISFV